MVSKSDTKGVISHWGTFLCWLFMGDFSLTTVHVKLMIYDSGDLSEMPQYMKINKQSLSRLLQEQTDQGLFCLPKLLSIKVFYFHTLTSPSLQAIWN